MSQYHRHEKGTPEWWWLFFRRNLLDRNIRTMTDHEWAFALDLAKRRGDLKPYQAADRIMRMRENQIARPVRADKHRFSAAAPDAVHAFQGELV